MKMEKFTLLGKNFTLPLAVTAWTNLTSGSGKLLIYKSFWLAHWSFFHFGTDPGLGLLYINGKSGSYQTVKPIIMEMKMEISGWSS